MKTITMLCLLVCAAALVACTATPPPVKQTSEYTQSDHYKRMVKANAERKNVKVYWVNPPDDDDLDKDDH